MNVLARLSLQCLVALVMLNNCSETQTDNQNADTPPLDGRGGGILTMNSNRDGNNEVYIMNGDGSGQRNATNNPANDGFGAWSPDGMKLAFVSDRGGSFGVYVMDVIDLPTARFSPPVKVADKRPSSRVVWSPDGAKLLFDAWPECELYIVDIDGSNLTKITQTPEEEYQPQYFPDGLKIVYAGGRNSQDLFIMDADGNNPEAITSDGVSFFPTLSPDGRMICFNSSRPGRQDVDLCLMPAAGGARIWLTSYPNHDEFPTWSPDGMHIAYQSQRGVHQIFVMDVDGSNNHPITDNTAYENGEPNWRPVN